jgi:hypothetical protein
MSANQDLSHQPLEGSLHSVPTTQDQSDGTPSVIKSNSLPLCWGHRGVSGLRHEW